MENIDLVVTALVASLTLALLIVAAILLLVTSSNRRNRHRAEMAELLAKRDRELLLTERETTRYTLKEVGRELHDNLGQMITVAQVGVKNVIEGSMGKEVLVSVREALEQGIAEVRRLSHDLNSDLWESRTLADAIRSEAERIERMTRIKVAIAILGEPLDPGPGIKTLLFRTFQEIMTNAIRHGNATEIRIILKEGKEFGLTMIDNGKGFDLANTKANAGLTNIHKRCTMIGYDAICTTSPGNGCKWELQPFDNAI